jgi:hypothetical protein
MASVYSVPFNPSSATAAATIGKVGASKETFVSALRLGRPESALAPIHRRSGRGDDILHQSILQTYEIAYNVTILPLACMEF